MRLCRFVLRMRSSAWRAKYRDLRKQAQALIDERVRLEEELSGLRRRVQRLDEDVRSLRSPPLIIGTIMEVVEGANLAIVRSSNGTVFQVALNQHLDRNALLPGTRVTLNGFTGSHRHPW